MKMVHAAFGEVNVVENPRFTASLNKVVDVVCSDGIKRTLLWDVQPEGLVVTSKARKEVGAEDKVLSRWATPAQVEEAEYSTALWSQLEATSEQLAQ